MYSNGIASQFAKLRLSWPFRFHRIRTASRAVNDLVRHSTIVNGVAWKRSETSRVKCRYRKAEKERRARIIQYRIHEPHFHADEDDIPLTSGFIIKTMHGYNSNLTSPCLTSGSSLPWNPRLLTGVYDISYAGRRAR